MVGNRDFAVHRRALQRALILLYLRSNVIYFVHVVQLDTGNGIRSALVLISPCMNVRVWHSGQIYLIISALDDCTHDAGTQDLGNSQELSSLHRHVPVSLECTQGRYSTTRMKWK